MPLNYNHIQNSVHYLYLFMAVIWSSAAQLGTHLVHPVFSQPPQPHMPPPSILICVPASARPLGLHTISLVLCVSIFHCLSSHKFLCEVFHVPPQIHYCFNFVHEL